MEALTPSDYDTHIRNLLDSLGSAQKVLKDKTEPVTKPPESTNVSLLPSSPPFPTN
jgi:hypothetical protein